MDADIIFFPDSAKIFRHVTNQGDMNFYDDEENNLIIDNGCDQQMINLTSFLVHTYTGVFILVNGDMKSMEGSSLEIVNDAYTLATFDNGSIFLLKLNKCLCDPDPLASEPLLQPLHECHHSVLVDGCDKRHLS